MFLIEYASNKFVNGERIDWLSIDKVGIISFTVEGDNESAFFVDTELNKQFLNNLQAVDHNNFPLERRHDEVINNPQPSQT